MLLDDFFTIAEIRPETEGFTAQVKLKKNHKIYEGHFPGNPVVPGVCLTQMIKELVEKELNKQLNLTKANNIKFMNFVNPLENDILNILIGIKQAEEIQVKATVFFEEKTFLKFVGTFK